MATIRQEINLLCGTLTADGDSNERAQITTTSYSGSATYYFEVVGQRASGTCTVTLHDASNNVMATCSITGTSHALVRSSSFTPTAGSATYHVNVAGGSTTPIIKAARIVIIQVSTPLTATETQIEIGGRFSTTSTTGSPDSAPKYWKYTGGNWDGTLAVYFEAVFKSGTSKSASSVKLQVADGTGDGFVGWADVTNGTVTTTSTSTTLVRGTSLVTLVAGRNYRIVGVTPSSKSAMNVYCAKIVLIQQAKVEGAYDGTAGPTAIYGGTGTSGENNQAACQSITPASSFSLDAVAFWMAKWGSPTDNVYVEIRTTGPTGTLVATSNNVSCSGLPSYSSLQWSYFAFGTPVALSSGTVYYFVVQRSGARDATNYVAVVCSTGSQYTGGTAVRNNNAWGSETATIDAHYMFLQGSLLTKLEPQYLLANTSFAAGTALQLYLTSWDSVEWSGVTNTYSFAVSAYNDSTSYIDLYTADGVTMLARVASPDNQGISAIASMPSSQNLDVKAPTNNVDIYDSRILVACVMVSSAIKTVMDLARASCKTVNDLAIASVKTINDLA